MPDLSVQREDVYRQTIDAARFGVVAKPLSAWERFYNLGAVRKCLLLVVLAAAWEVYARWLDNALLFPTFGATVGAFYNALVHGELLARAWTSIRILLVGYVAGITLAAVLTVVAITSRIGTDLLETLTSMFNPVNLPSLRHAVVIETAVGAAVVIIDFIRRRWRRARRAGS